jgi:hypothetical protein
MSDCCRRALRCAPEPAPSLPCNPFADFREHSPPKQVDAGEEPVVRHASEVHLQMPSGFAQDGASTVAMTSRSCPGRTSRPAFASATQANGGTEYDIPRHGSAVRCGCSPAARSGRGWCPARAQHRRMGSQASAGDSRLPEKPSEDTAGTFTSRRSSVRFHFRTVERVPPRRLDTRRHRRRYAPSRHHRPRGLYSESARR